MAKEPKKGKFNYGLDSVLKVREIFEKQQKAVFAEKERILNEEKQKEEELKNWQDQMNTELRNSMIGEIKDFGTILRRRSHLVKVKEDVETQEDIRVKAEKIREEQREKLELKMKERKVIEKDKDNKKEDWRKFMDKDEGKFLDDIANSHHGRK